jgi:hypothetical protein
MFVLGRTRCTFRSTEVRGDPRVTKGSIPAEPDEKLTRAEIIALAVP